MRRVILACLLAACGGGASGPRDGGGGGDGNAPPLADAAPGTVTVADGEDWSLPPQVVASPNSGFFSEEAAPAFHVDTRVVDVTWRQLAPTPTTYSTTATGAAQGMSFASLDDQLAGSDKLWMRIWASGVDWAPAWVVADCGVAPITGADYEGQAHLPIWNACVWGHLMDLYRELFVTRGLAADDRLQLVYVPGAFTWCEFDFDMIANAAQSDGLTFGAFDAWFQAAMPELATMFGANKHKLVYTGEDYPFSSFGAADDLLARDAVTAGLGIRTGISEVANFHLSHVPAYGTTIAPDGHMITDEAWPLLDGKRVAAAEHECYTDCGFTTGDPYYAVRLSNLKALQLHMNWIYVVPGPSYMSDFAAHWEWVRLELGKTAATAPDAWAALREAEDTYWIDDDSHTWAGDPYVVNLERWLVQRDVAAGGLSRRGSEQHTGVLDPANGTAWEGRATDHAAGSDFLYFDVADGFLHDTTGAAATTVQIKVTYRDTGAAIWSLEYAAAGGGAPKRTPTVTNGGTGALRTASFTIADAAFDDSLADSTDFRLFAGGAEDVEVTFVRVIKL